MVPVETCCVCDTADADVIARGYDFEYATSPDEFSACRCRACRELVKRAQYLAGLKGYVTNIKTDIMDGDCVVAAYHDLYLVERSFWTTKTDLAAQCSTGCAIASRPTSPSCSPLAVSARHRPHRPVHQQDRQNLRPLQTATITLGRQQITAAA